MGNENYPWDSFSDQPHVIKNKAYKRSLYKRGALSSLKTFLFLPILPIISLRLLFIEKYRIGQKINNIGLCVNVTETPGDQTHVTDEQTVALVEELGIEDLLIRIPLSDIENLDTYITFIKRFKGKRLLINVLQDRRHVEDLDRLKQSLRKIFEALSEQTKVFQIGNAINRKKWAFISVEEYLHFFSVAQTLRDEQFPEISLLGGNIIDFEVPNFARSIFHRKKIKYDGVAVQLYVDRRGAPENRQFGFDLVAKIKCFFDLIYISKKASNKLYITETNWPLLETEPFAPAVGDCMVNEEDQARYLIRYFLLMIASGRVEKCYWHQLVAPGYGLIDNRGKKVRKRKAFYCLKALLSLFNDTRVTRFERKRNGGTSLTACNEHGNIRAIWNTRSTQTVILASHETAINAAGEPFPREQKQIPVGGEPIYIFDYESQATRKRNESH